MKNRPILLVEDNADDEELTLMSFKKSKVANEIHVVRDGQEALDYLKREGAHSHRADQPMPQVVLLDLKLPKVDGLDVLKEIRKYAPTQTLPIVILTSSREQKDIVESYRLGVNSYVCKPVDIAEFMQAVGQLGMYWLLLNENPP
jgi:two-component system response regulator